MVDGNVFELFRGVMGPLNRFFDYLFYAGAIYCARAATRLIILTAGGLRTYFIPIGRVSDGDLSVKYGKWAVITGGTSGIGLAYAHEFARRNLNVVLIGKSYDDLVNIISELQTQYNVQIYGIYADFSLGFKVYQDVEDALKDLEIGILVNNVCVRYDHPQYFALVPHQRVWQIVNANVTAITVMTHMLLPQMLQRKRGAIINVCSVSACTPPIPLTAEYTASMAYVDKFSQALYHENKRRGVCVQTLLPCFVTQLGTRPSVFAPSAETYVRHAIATLGIRSRISGYWPHALQGWLCSLLPERLWVWFTRYFNTVTRQRCLREREASGAPLFSRKIFNRFNRRPSPLHIEGGGARRHDSVSSRHGSELSLHHSLSPRKLASKFDGGGAETPSPSMHRRTRNSASDMKRKISLEEISRSRSSSSGSRTIPPPIREDSPSASPLSTPEIGQVHSPRLDRASPPPSASALPRRSSTVSSLDPPARRMSTCRRTSRVLVMPTVAMVSYSPEPGAQGNNNLTNHNNYH